MDLKESIKFIRNKRPVIWKLSLMIASVNLFFSSLIIISLPVIITQLLGFSEKIGNQLYGYASGVLAAGSMIGGVMAGIFSKKLKVHDQYLMLIIAAFTLLPIAAALFFTLPAMAVYLIIMICCFFMMIMSSLFSIQMLSYLQLLTPEHMLGKVISCAMCICMCAQPIGQAVYGVVVEKYKNSISFPFIAAFAITTVIALRSRSLFKEVDACLKEQKCHK